MHLIAIAAAALIALAVQAPTPLFFVAPLVPVGLLAWAAHLRSPRFLPIAALALAVTPFPEGVPRLVPFGGRSLFLTDLVLPVVAALALRQPSRTPAADRAVRAYAFLATAFLVHGAVRGAGFAALIQDARGPLYLLCGYVIATRLLDLEDRRAVVRTVAVVLWWSVALIALSLLAGRPLVQGRVGETQGFVGDGAKAQLEAVRFLIASKELALIALVAGLGGLLLRAQPVRWRSVLGVLAPALFVVFMAFSRQSVIGLAVGLLLVLVVSPHHLGSLGRLLVVGAATVALVAVLGVLGVAQRITDPDEGLLGPQIEGFMERVVGGLGGDNVTEDAGNRFRVLENQAAMRYLGDHLVLGGGLGATYREQLPLEAFRQTDVDYGRRYVHNVYLWYAVKGGLLGLLAIAVLLIRPLLRVVLPAARAPGRHRGEILALGGALAAIVVVGLVEPVIHLEATAPIVGALIGVLGVLGRDRSAAAVGELQPA